MYSVNFCLRCSAWSKFFYCPCCCLPPDGITAQLGAPIQLGDTLQYICISHINIYICAYIHICTFIQLCIVFYNFNELIINGRFILMLLYTIHTPPKSKQISCFSIVYFRLLLIYYMLILYSLLKIQFLPWRAIKLIRECVNRQFRESDKFCSRRIPRIIWEHTSENFDSWWGYPGCSFRKCYYLN